MFLVYSAVYVTQSRKAYGKPRSYMQSLEGKIFCRFNFVHQFFCRVLHENNTFSRACHFKVMFETTAVPCPQVFISKGMRRRCVWSSFNYQARSKLSVLLCTTVCSSARYASQLAERISLLAWGAFFRLAIYDVSINNFFAHPYVRPFLC